MKYEKPEVVNLASAVTAVQGSSNKSNDSPADSFHHATASAYEADE